jgi:hypothetical protein
MNDELDDSLKVDEVAEENEAAIAYDIAAYPSDLTLSVVYEMWRNKDIVIPDYQRNFVWDIKQSSLLIESFLLGLPVPQVFFYVDEQNKNQVIDGQQRIMTVVFYLDGFFGSENVQGKKQVFRLQGLHEKSPYAKKEFSALDDSQQRRLKGAVLRAINIRQLNPKGQPTSVYHIFERLNTGGTPLKAQEIRNCVFRGKFADLLRELNDDPNWRRIIGKKTLDRHQKDIELILRIFALGSSGKKYEKPMKEFLNKIMEGNKDASAPSVQSFSQAFTKACKVIADTLPEKPFHVRGPLNSSALDAVFSVVVGAIDKLPSDLAQRFERLNADQSFKDATFYSTSDSAVIDKRFEAARLHLLG